MKSHLLKCLPVLALTLALGACSKQAAQKSGGNSADNSAAVSAAQRLSTMFEADCGASAPAASSSADYDLTSCQLNSPQLTYLSGLGPFKVEADCVRQSVTVHNDKDDITGMGSINADGTYSVPLIIGSRFAEVEGCPVNLQGNATGSVTCDQDRKVTHVDVNTVFTFEQPEETPSNAVTAALMADALPADGQVHGDRPREHAGKEVIPVGKGDKHDGKGGKPEGDKPVVSKGDKHDGDKHEGKGGKDVVPSKGIISKGGESGGDHGGPGHHERLEACVKFPSCGFTTKAGLSCTSAAPAPAPAPAAAVTAPAPADASAPAAVAPAPAPSEASAGGR